MGYPLKCFLDAYKGYHQVQMSEEDEENTTFYTDQGTFCYKKMPFGLKNAGATYQRLVDEAFDKQIGRNLEVYVDDMVIKSKAEKDMLADIAETFDNLRRINMKLNPKKCSFGVEEGKFLGYMVTSEGIRANPAKTKDIAEMKSPRTWGEMQSLAGRLAALNRFLARSAEKSLPFFETLKNITKENKEDYRWTEEAEKAFQELKKTILNLPTLTTPIPEENLYIYLAASDKAVSAVLMTGQNVITDQSIKQILGRAETLGRLAQYAVELGAYKITYELRNSIKGQVLADFLNEIPIGSDTLVPRETTYAKEDKKERQEEWMLFTDGASSSKGSGAGLVLISPTKTEYTYALRLTFESTNNQAEYEALLAGLRIAKKWWNQNQKADVLSKLASVAFNHLTKEILVETLDTPSMDYGEINAIVEEEGENWMSPIIRCLEEGPLQANYVIREIHMGACSMHMKPRSVVAKAIRQGYYWPTMHRDAREEIRKCDSCQIHAPVPKMPKTLMTSIMAPWPFYQWGMDVLGPLPEAPGKVKYVIVAIDYFTKWIEAKPLARTTGKEVKKFVWDNIVCRFGLPKIITTDNGTNFVNDPFKGWCERLNIIQINTAVAHPQANGLVERANRSLMEGIKTRLGRERKGWVDELPNVLWAHRTSLKTSNGETPYSLTFGSEAVIPAEVGMPTHRTMMIKDGKDNEEEIRLNLDLLTERREAAAIREARYKTKVEQYYNKRVRPMAFKVGEYVYRRNEASRVEDLGKLGPKWEGPYLVIEAYDNGSYKLQTMEGREVPRTWHAINLRRCYL
ncbi:reverse transcriptase domain-containing protein [Tanacetum coccineum]|uniref:Reverse transcriptase domain-containing protein n=1 Tax=Tanacetum coccineum TaxID=301880 RepID=A0ABQ5DHR8_9ASTR